MIKTILIIIVSVAIFGLIIFVIVRNLMKRKLEEIGREDINKYGMYIKFTCRIDDSI